MRRNEGFTLVEVMVVAIIVAILAAVAIPLMTGNTDRAVATEGQAGCSTVRTAVRVYFVENGAYPAANTVVTTLPGINPGDLLGRYFNDASYVLNPGGAAYLITATSADANHPGDVTLNAAGTWGGSLLQ